MKKAIMISMERSFRRGLDLSQALKRWYQEQRVRRRKYQKKRRGY